MPTWTTELHFFSPLCHFWMARSNRVDLCDSPSTRQCHLSTGHERTSNSNILPSFKSPVRRHRYSDFHRISKTKFILQRRAAFSCLALLPRCQWGEEMIHLASRLTPVLQQAWLIYTRSPRLAHLKCTKVWFILSSAGAQGEDARLLPDTWKIAGVTDDWGKVGGRRQAAK